MLPAAGVLEFVHKQMVDIVGNGEGTLSGRTFGCGECLLGDLRHLYEIDLAHFGEDAFQASGSVAKENEAGTDDAPVVVREMDRRKAADGEKRLSKLGTASQVSDQVKEALLLWFDIGREALILGDLSAERVVLGHQQAREVLVDRECDGQFRIIFYGERASGKGIATGNAEVPLAVQIGAGELGETVNLGPIAGREQ